MVNGLAPNSSGRSAKNLARSDFVCLVFLSCAGGVMAASCEAVARRWTILSVGDCGACLVGGGIHYMKGLGRDAV